MTSVRISSDSQRIAVIAEGRDDVVVEGDARVVREGDRTTIDRARSRLIVRVPAGTDLVVGTTSARIDVTGTVGAAGITTEAGRIEIETAGSLDARTRSGRVTVGRVEGRCRVRSKSARVEIGACGGADVATESGRVHLGHATGDVVAHCVSGRIEIGLDTPRDVDAETVSGRISIRLPRDARPHRLGRGDAETAAEPAAGTNCTVRAVSVSGRVEVSVG